MAESKSPSNSVNSTAYPGERVKPLAEIPVRMRQTRMLKARRDSPNGIQLFDFLHQISALADYFLSSINDFLMRFSSS